MIIEGTYNLEINPIWRAIQTEAVYLECDTSDNPVIINLFPIRNLEGFWNVKIYITDLAQNCSNNNIIINTGFINEPPIYDIVDESGNNQVVLNIDGESTMLQPMSNNQWMAIESVTIPSAVQSVKGLNTNNSDPLNPIIKIALDNSTITGEGTIQSPLISKLVIGSSVISEGSTKSILFNNDGIVTETPEFNYDLNTKVLSIGGETSSAKGTLNIKAKDSLPTAYSIAVRKSTDNAYLFQVRNDGKVRFNDAYNLPEVDGADGQALVTNGAGDVSFQPKQNIITLTTSGNSGASSLVSDILNIPTYTVDGLGAVPLGRTLTINGTTQDLLENRTWVIPTDITVANTNILSGIDNAIVFQKNGVVQEDANFVYDKNLKRLTLKLSGALSTDIALVLRNSADNKNILEVRGDSETRFNGNVAVGNYVAIKNYTSYDANIDFMSGDGVKARIWHDISSNSNINRGVNIWTPGIVGNSTAKINNIVRSGLSAYGAGYGFNWAFTTNTSGIFTQAERALWLTSTKSMVLYNGSSIPDTHTEKADSFEMYASDIVAGNSAPHFKTENGSIIKLYKETTSVASATFVSLAGTNLTDTDTFDGYTLKQVVRVLKNIGIL